MKFTINRIEFLKALRIATGVINPRPVLPILTGVKMELRDDTLTLTGSDGDISIFSKIYANDTNQLHFHEEGGVVLDAKILLNAVSKFESETINLEIMDGAYTKLSGGSAEININGSNLDAYPKIEIMKNDIEFNIEEERLKDLIRRTIFAVAHPGTNEDKPFLTGVNVRNKEGNLTFASSNTFRVAIASEEIYPVSDFSVTIPSKTMHEISKHLTGMITVGIANTTASFKTKDAYIQTRLVDGLYPDLTRLAPTDTNSDFSIDQDILVGAIDRAAIIKEETIPVIGLVLNNQEVFVKAKSQELGSTEEKIDATLEKEYDSSLKIAFNGNYLREAVKSYPKGNVVLKVIGPKSPMIVTDSINSKNINIIMPLNVEV